MEPRLFETFCEEFTKEVNRQLIERRATLVAQRKELERVERDLDRAIQAILDGVPGARLKDKIGALEARKAELTAILAEAKEPPALLHPNMAHLYREHLAALHEALEENATRAEAAEAIRVLIDRVTLVPENGELGIVLRGDLAAMLSFAGSKKPGAVSRAGPQALAVQASLVAGARSHRIRHSPVGPIRPSVPSLAHPSPGC